MEFKILKSEPIYQGKTFDVRREHLLLPDGNTTWFEIVDHPGAVTLIPVDSQGRVLFVRQYRHAIGKELLELPAGTLNIGESPRTCALREVREETGMSAAKLERVGEFFLAPGYSTEYMYIYLAYELQIDPLPGDEDEFITVQPIPLDQLPELVSQGEIQDAKSLVARSLAAPFLKKFGE
jgi:ADP-ribose pyrophosphatase